ncbi:Zeatin O-glucosyltransferase [Vitis vinifera]|uniref:Zeatin O-glucosyltransferase n=1 Tax=Vitis vinifera TaxID=29760 RepID=A0A438JL49_VITVI|nr:Zeatin O-glucosyltransferase [Vitis vinifera]
MKEAPVAVVMVPFPAQGHLNQLLQLSRLISSYNVSVHYVGSVTHTHQAKLRVQAHLESSFEASSQLRQPVAALLRELSPRARRIIVIHDSLMGSVIQDVALYEAKFLEDVPSLDGCFPLEFLNFIASQHQFKKLNSGNIYNTCKSMEGCYVDLLDGLEIYGGKKKHWALGPFNPLTICYDKKSNPGHRCLGWLDKQAPKSVLLVSFGTTTSLTDEQIKELAIGLEQSKQKFIWVLRDADKGDVFSGEVRRAELPEGSTGGFMSHCGWNSCLESISMGVPIAAWPMHSDQPRNTVLVAQVLKVGLVVRDWAQREQLVAASTVEKKVRSLMASKEGDDMRKRAAELGATIQRSMDEGGVSRKELDSFVAHITR